MILHYRNKNYALTLVDGFYLTTVKPSTSGNIESILCALQESKRFDSFKQKTGIQFTVTNNGIEVNPKDVISLIGV
jgi:hypothetical protein